MSWKSKDDPSLIECANCKHRNGEHSSIDYACLKKMCPCMHFTEVKPYAEPSELNFGFVNSESTGFMVDGIIFPSMLFANAFTIRMEQARDIHGVLAAGESPFTILKDHGTVIWDEMRQAYVFKPKEQLNQHVREFFEGAAKAFDSGVISVDEARSLVKNDPVNHPSHYTDGKIEVWDFIRDKNLNFLLGSVVKYVSRAGKKDPATHIQDLKKAAAFLNREIEELEKNGS